MPEPAKRPQPSEARLAADRPDDDLHLADLPWSDGIVGMGFFPDEVGLSAEWRWSAHGLRR